MKVLMRSALSARTLQRHMGRQAHNTTGLGRGARVWHKWGCSGAHKVRTLLKQQPSGQLLVLLPQERGAARG